MSPDSSTSLRKHAYDRHCRDAILTPAGLHRRGFLHPGFKPNEPAHGYLPKGPDHGTMLAKAHATDGPYWNLRGNGGMLSTSADMHAFYKALFETEKLLTRAIAGVLTALIKAINSGDNAALRRFITDSFVSEAGGPSVDERLQRIGRMHENLGDITIEKIQTFDQGPVEMKLRSSVQGAATLKVMMTSGEPYRIQGMQILVGG